MSVPLVAGKRSRRVAESAAGCWAKTLPRHRAGSTRVRNDFSMGPNLAGGRAADNPKLAPGDRP
jgi:hypothetical protein